MTFSQKILAWILMKTDKINRDIYDNKKRELFQDLHGTIVELGPGTGLNLEYYPKNIRWIGIEPNPKLRQEILNKAKKLEMKNVQVLNASAEQIPLKDEITDVVITTLMLCSVKDLPKVIQETKRVLKKNGKFLFIEHVAGKKRSVRRIVQNILVKTPYIIISDGCHPNRDIGKTIKTHFQEVKFKEFVQEKDRSILDKIFMFPINPHIYGYAKK